MQMCGKEDEPDIRKRFSPDLRVVINRVKRNATRLGVDAQVALILATFVDIETSLPGMVLREFGVTSAEILKHLSSTPTHDLLDDFSRYVSTSPGSVIGEDDLYFWLLDLPGTSEILEHLGQDPVVLLHESKGLLGRL